MRWGIRATLSTILLVTLAVAQAAPTEYTPKFKGDPAKSDAESSALGYLRTVVRAERYYNSKVGHYATTLRELGGHGSFTKRMAKTTDRGDYTVDFNGKKNSYSVALTPKQFDESHRAFYAKEDGKIRVESDKPAGPSSPVLR